MLVSTGIASGHQFEKGYTMPFSTLKSDSFVNIVRAFRAHDQLDVTNATDTNTNYKGFECRWYMPLWCLDMVSTHVTARRTLHFLFLFSLNLDSCLINDLIPQHRRH